MPQRKRGGIFPPLFLLGLPAVYSGSTLTLLRHPGKIIVTNIMQKGKMSNKKTALRRQA